MLADRIADWLADHPGSLVDEIARGVRARTATVRETLTADRRFVSAPRALHGSDNARLWSVVVGAQDGPGRGKTPTHNEKVLALLADGRPHTHHELYALHVIGHSRVNDLRKRGYQIDQWREGDVYLYQLTSTNGGRGPAAADNCGSAPTPTAETVAPLREPSVESPSACRDDGTADGSLSGDESSPSSWGVAAQLTLDEVAA